MTEKSPESHRQSTGRVVAVCISRARGTPKVCVQSIELRASWGAVGDAHAGPWHRQLSLLADESAELIREKGLVIPPGAFGENILTAGVELHTLRVGAVLRIGSAEVEVTQIGKACHDRCEIFERVGTCVMPTHGVFARVTRTGTAGPDDPVEVISD